MLPPTPHTLSCIRTISHVSQLPVFKEPGSAGTILQRNPPADVLAWIAQLPEGNLPGGRVIMRPSEVRDVVGQLCDMVEMPSGQERNWLQNDIAALVDEFSGLMKSPYIRLRLDVVKDDACRKFHVDAIAARLICTYRGTGTQYGISLQGEEPRRIFNVDTGVPILLRGSLWPEWPRSGLRHRSPPIEGSGDIRLVLVVDPITDPEGEI